MVYIQNVFTSLMEFEWDEHKNQQNQKKHGLRFEEAQEIFLLNRFYVD
jgi:uncharacterized DUF497 family protein